jgi:hypothetical protein
MRGIEGKGIVTLKNFIKFYENQKDEKLPTV